MYIPQYFEITDTMASFGEQKHNEIDIKAHLYVKFTTYCPKKFTSINH